MDQPIEVYIDDLNKATDIYTSTVLLFKENGINHKELIEHLIKDVFSKMQNLNRKLMLGLGE